MANYSHVHDDDGNYALMQYPALHQHLETHPGCEIDCRWSIFVHKWLAYVVEGGKRVYEAEHVDPKTALAALDHKVEWQRRSVEEPHFVAQNLVIQSLLAQCGGKALIALPADLDGNDRGSVLRALEAENVSARIDGNTVILRLAPSLSAE
jgi:hypothetical protein